MTCFWDGIIKSLNYQDFELINETKGGIAELIEMLKRRRIPMEHVSWENQKLKNIELKEHLTAIEEYDSYNDGHLTSSCDSFLLLICELFKVSIEHMYMINTIHYVNMSESRRIIRYSSNDKHFVFSR